MDGAFFWRRICRPFADSVSKKHRPIMARILCNPVMPKSVTEAEACIFSCRAVVNDLSLAYSQNKTAIQEEF
jgi:hypothetical protein